MVQIQLILIFVIYLQINPLSDVVKLQNNKFQIN
jgi:hypothetical protein